MWRLGGVQSAEKPLRKRHRVSLPAPVLPANVPRSDDVELLRGRHHDTYLSATSFDGGRPPASWFPDMEELLR